MSCAKACRLIREGVKDGLLHREECSLQSPAQFEMEINYKECADALRASFYPGAKQLDERTVTFTGKDIQEIMTAQLFIL